jgi:hypothetical protein
VIESADERAGPSDIGATNNQTLEQKRERIFSMAGQIGTGTFDVNTLVVTEPGAADAPSNIIPVGGDFDISLTFTGTGTPFKGFENLGTAYNVSYYLEGIGANAAEIDLGSMSGNLVPGQGTYQGAATRLSILANALTPGVYRAAGLVTFPGVPGMTGFVEDLLIQVFQP